MKKRYFAYLTFIFIVTFFNFLSCEVGLGSSVDTETPSISIDYPPKGNDVFICGEFLLYGKWYDDKGLKSVTVEVSAGNTPIDTVEASFNKNKTWQVNLNKYTPDDTDNYNGYKYADGEYTFRVICVDGAGHSSEDKRTLKIDNSAPVIQLDSPNTFGNTLSPREYGQIVQFTGFFAEQQNKISRMIVDFYDVNGNKLYEGTYKNIKSMSESSPLPVARYYSDENSRTEYADLFNAYKAIIGQDVLDSYESGNSIDIKQIYCSITAFDDAKVYDDPKKNPNGSGEGNKTEIFYRGAGDFGTLVSGDGEIENFSLQDFADYVNKVTTDISAENKAIIDSIELASRSYSTTADVITNVTNEDSTTGENVYLTFAVNPKNNPMTTVGGYIVDLEKAVSDPDNYSSAGYKKTYSGTPYTIQVNLGPDNKYIDTQTVSMYVIDITKYTGALTETMFRGEIGKQNYENGYFELLFTYDTEVKDEFALWGYDVSSIFEKKTNTSDSISKNFSVGTFESGHDYRFYVVGNDVAGSMIVDSSVNGFGFCGATNATAPTISATEGNKLNSVIKKSQFTGEGAVSKSDVLYVSGTISSDEVLTSLSYVLTLTDSKNDKVTRYEDNFDIQTYNSAAPDYSSDFISNYCYTIDAASTPIIYNWRFTSAQVKDIFIPSIGQGDYEVSLVITANNGATSTFQRTFTLDTQAPSSELSEISVAAEDSTSSFYWINPAKSLTVSGLVTDNLSTAKACTNWVKLVALSDADTEVSSTAAGDVYTSDEQSGVNKWSFTVPASQITSTYYGANLYIYSRDAAGNIGQSIIKLVFDTTAPSGKHALDGKNKDIFFRIGSYNNDDISKAENPALWNDDLDTDVGGKYQENTYGNTTTIKFRGNFVEEGSGLNMIYYKVVSSSTEIPYDDLKAQALEFYANYNKATDYTGYFAPLAEGSEKTKRVFYTSVNGVNGNIPLKYIDKNGNIQTSATEYSVTSTNSITDSKGNKKYYANIVSNFESVISGFSTEGTNYLILVVEDKVGNASLDSVIAKDSNGNEKIFYNASVNVDAESPILVCSSHNGQQYTNGVSPIIVEGTYTDLPSSKNSGVSKITVEVNGVSSTAELNNGFWSAQILSSTLSALDENGTYNVNGTITDSAGNSNSATLFTLSYDKSAPSVEIKSPAVLSSINKLMTLTGSVTYSGSSPKELVLYASTSVPSGDYSDFEIVGTITDESKIYSWSIDDIDTYVLTAVADSPTTAELYFIPVVTDNAGNNNVYDFETSSFKYVNGTNYFKYIVDMNSDRPTVKVTNLTLSDGNYILKYGEDAKIEGTVTDDDSTSTVVVKTFVATTSQISSTTNVTSTTDAVTGIVTNKVKVGTSTYDITTFNPSTGEWTFTPADTADGEKTVYFYIADNADSVFYTGKTVTVNAVNYNYEQPYFRYKTSEAVDSSSSLTYKSDATAPSIRNTLVHSYDSSKMENGSATAPGTNFVAGGKDRQYVKFRVTGYDANEIEGIRLTLNYKELDDGSDAEIKIASCSNYTGEGFAKSGTITGTTTAVWTTDYVDLSVMQTGSVSGTVEVFDKSGLFGTSSPIFMVDNDGPAVKVNSPSSNDELTGDITFSGTSTDIGNAGVVQTAWLIPTATQRSLSDSELAVAVDGSGNSVWNTDLDTDTSETVWKFTLTSAVLSAYDSSTYYTAENNSVYTLPFYVKTTDEIGNVTVYRNFTFKHNPNADRPDVDLLYPSNTGVDFVTLGGAIRISGSAVIPSNTTTVNSVYVQIMNGTGNLEENESISDKYTLSSAYAVSKGFTVLNKAQIQSIVGEELSFADELDWGIKAEKTGSWSLTINEGGELNPSEGELTYLAIRACAVNAEGKVGTWTDWVYVNIDDTAPTQSAMLYQFSSAPTQGCTASTVVSASNIIASSLYKSDMYLKGEWYLTVKLHDESELSSYTVTKKTDGGSASSVTPVASTKVTGSDGKEQTQYLFIPVDTSATSLEYSVVVKDSEHTITSSYTLKIDNTAPVIEAVYKGATDNSANYLKTTEANIIADSNYIYTLGGKVDETGSGFKNLAFYFVRANAIDGETYTTEAILDPLITSGTSDAKATISANLTPRPFTQGEDTYYLYAKEISGNLGSGGDTFIPSTAANITDNAHIRIGGLIEIAGLLRRIDDIDSTTGEVTFSPETGITDGASITAYFAYAQVVDNTSTESVSSSSANPFTFKNNSDDGDNMPETLTGSTSVGYSWDATVHTYNIPDGPCALVVLAFDAAGNVSGEVYPVKVENSAPRLAKIFLGTDLNSSATWTANEFSPYNVYDANTTYGIDITEVKAEQTISTAAYGSAFAIKDKLAVVAEIVGGNGDIMMVYGRGASSTAAVTSSYGIIATVNSDIENLVSSQKIGTVSYNNVDTATSLKGYTLTNSQIVAAVTEANDGTGKSASFTFWDSTDELVQGLTSQNCVLLVNDFTIDLVDSLPPKVVVNPFYWESASKNSLYANSSSKGHIELEGDLAGTAAATLYGTDPKVSGKITFTGTAYDEHSLKNLKFTLTNASGTALTGFANIAMGTYDSTSTDATYVANGGWSALSGNSGNALSDGGSYEWTISTSLTDSSRFYEDTAYLSQDGHKVYWTISIDTAQIPNVAEKDITLTVTTTDQISNSSVNSSASAPDTTDGAYIVTDGTTHVPSYKVDVVPYITGIKTSVRKASGLKDNNIRSASGKYSILANNAENVITLTGFNFSTADFVAKIANEATSGGTAITKTSGGTSLTASATATTRAEITNSGITKSGYLEIFSNGVRALNNINNNDAHGSFERTSSVEDYKNMPNRVNEADFYTTKNVTLTDDRYLRFFDMKDTGKKNAYYPNLVMEGDDPVFGFVDLNGATDNNYGNAQIRNGYQPQRAKFSGTNGSQTSIEYLIGGLSWDQMGMATDSAGKYIHTSVYNYSGATMAVIYDQFASQYTWRPNNTGYTYYTGAWGNGTMYSNMSNNAGTTYYIERVQVNGNNGISIDSVDFGEGTLIGRYQNIKMIAKGNSTSTAGASVYMAYYDDNTENKDVIFRTFQIKKTNTNTWNQLGETDLRTNLTENNTSGRIAVRPTDDTTVKGSKYLDIGVTSNNRVVIVFYDMEEGKIRMYYSGNAIDGSSITPTPNWTAANVEFPDYVGTDVSMVIDDSDGIHITASDATDSDLVYMYLPSYDSSSLKVITIDQAFSVGTWTSIKLRGNSTDGYIPYIAYYNATETGSRDAIKLVYFAASDKSIKDSDENSIQGVDSSGYTTGNWEYMTVPAITPPQGGDNKFRSVCLDFDSNGLPVVGYLGTNLEFGKWLAE